MCIQSEELGTHNKIYFSDSEFERIPIYLSNIDRKVRVVGIEIDEMKEFKKGLLQQMFV